MKRICFVIPSMDAGGAERVVSILLNHLDPQRFSASLILFNREGIFLKDLPPGLPVYDLKKRSALSLPRLVVGLARLLRTLQPDTVVSFLAYANLVLLLARKLVPAKPIRWIISERSLPSRDRAGERLGLVKALLHRRLDKWADRVITMSSETGDELVRDYHVPSNTIAVIPNPVPLARIRALAREPLDHPWFSERVPILIAVGRLSAEKNFAGLLNAFAGVAPNHAARLIILGDGDLKADLETQAQRLGIADRVWMPGFVSNPYAYVTRCDFLVLSSLYEGLPNVVLEAMALGKPVIATRCNRSLDELIRSGENGILVPPGDVPALQDAITSLLGDPAARERFGQAATGRISEFDVEAITRQYEDIF